MRYYAHFGHRDFILCLGYRGDLIREYFLNYRDCMSNDFVLSLPNGTIQQLESDVQDWRITFVDTGMHSNLGQRLTRVRHLLRNEDMFLANYSDGLTDANLDDMIEKFKASGKLACFLAIRPPLTYHRADIDGAGRVREFRTSDTSEIWINGGYFLFRKGIFEYMREGEELVIEPFRRLIADNQLLAYKHESFWRSMDTLRDRRYLEDLWASGRAPWKVW
jgi:glucose-1-phosphate cytidylyltransferase